MLTVLEGLDGAGKSTQLRMLSDYMVSCGKEVEHLHFPRYDAPVFGGMIARYLRGDYGAIDSVHPQIVALLFAEDRRSAAPLLRKMLDEDRCVILDRYVYSNIAFQCSKTASDEEAHALRDWILDIEYRQFGIPVPDLNLFLDVPISFVDDRLHETREGDDRSYLEGKNDIHEADIGFQKRVRTIYLEQCEADASFRRIDCSGSDGRMLPAEAIFEKIKSHIDNLV